MKTTLKTIEVPTLDGEEMIIVEYETHLETHPDYVAGRRRVRSEFNFDDCETIPGMLVANIISNIPDNVELALVEDMIMEQEGISNRDNIWFE